MRYLGWCLAAGVATAALAVACTSTGAPSTEAAVSAPATVVAAALAPEVRGNYEPYVDKSSFAFGYRRLTESQYRHAIADAFGKDVSINARFEPERREEGLQAVGNARLSITTSGLEQYLSLARSISDQVVDVSAAARETGAKDRAARVGCEPASKADAACAESFIKWRGRQLFRRPLAAEETAEYMATWSKSAEATGDFHKGLKLALVSMLMSPEFLFRA